MVPAPDLPNNAPTLWPEWTEEQRKERLIGEVYGNIRIEHPEITREQVAQRLELRQRAEIEIVPKQ
jgi:hypothetical protein